MTFAHFLNVLGLETSCDETAAAVIALPPTGQSARPKILSSIIHSQIADHSPYGGIVPEIAARAHAEVLDQIIARAMAQAGLDFADLDAVAATAGPGLVGGVMIGLMAAKAIALARNLPLIGINHLEGHALSVRLTEDLDFPYLLLLISGGHCQLLIVKDLGNYHRLGTTLDDAAGEAFDKIANCLACPYPGGPGLEQLAREGEPKHFSLPKILSRHKGCDFSFSGLKTAAARLAATLPEGDRQARCDLAAAVQKAIADQLVSRTQRAMALYEAEIGDLKPSGVKAFAVVGGVAANQHIRQRLAKLAQDRGFAFFVPPITYCTDNAAMIALAGAERLARGFQSPLDCAARPRWPLDELSALNRPSHAFGRKGAKS